MAETPDLLVNCETMRRNPDEHADFNRDSAVEIDLNHQIISALQINPRISWSRLGEILAADPTTLSRRWQRLLDDGLVWTTCFESTPAERRNPVRVAVVEIACQPGGREELAAALREEPLCYSLQYTSGDRDLVAMLSGPTLMALDDLVQERVAPQPGVVHTRTHYLHTLYRQGPEWRLRGITAAQARDVAQTLPPRNPNATAKRIHRDLIAALSPEPRAPISQLSQALGHSVPALARAVEVLLSADWVRFRIDLAHEHLGWEAEVVLWMDLEPSGVPRLAERLDRMDETRLCASMSGRANLTATLWLRRLTDLSDFEQRLRALEPTLQIVDRWIVPRVAKRLGHVLDRRGLHERYIPIGVPETAARH